MFSRKTQTAFAIGAAMIGGQMTASKAAAQTTPVATSPAQGLIAGSIIVDKSYVKGDMTAITFNATAATFSATGNNAYSNAYGGLADITLNAPIVPTAISGSVIATDSTLKQTNITVVDFKGSAIADAGNGYNTVTKNVGSVTQDTLNPVSYTTDAGTSGVIALSGVILPAGSLSATASDFSIISDTAGGPSTFVNNFGTYQSITLQGSGQPLTTGTLGAVSLSNTRMDSGNIAVQASINTVQSSDATGPGSVAESVGEVGKYTLNFTVVPATPTAPAASTAAPSPKGPGG